MGRRNEHSAQELRELALQATEKLIAEHGMAGFSMRKLAQSLGYSAGQLYLVFRNQDDLLTAVNERTAAAVLAHLQQKLSGQDLSERLRSLARAYIDFAFANPYRWALLFEHRLPEGMDVPQSNLDQVQALFDLVAQEFSGETLGAVGERKQIVAALWAGIHGVAALAQGHKLVWSGVQDYGMLADQLVEAVVLRVRTAA